METSSFPPEFLTPLQTAIGTAWPRPRTRMIMEQLENAQKRGATLRMRLGGVGHLQVDANMKQQRWNDLMAEDKVVGQEIQNLLKKLSAAPATKEQFKNPERDISECCQAYVKPATNEAGVPCVECVECGRFCLTYRRIDRENWAVEYQQVLREQEKERELALIEVAKKPAAKTVIKPGYLT